MNPRSASPDASRSVSSRSGALLCGNVCRGHIGGLRLDLSRAVSVVRLLPAEVLRFSALRQRFDRLRGADLSPQQDLR